MKKIVKALLVTLVIIAITFFAFSCTVKHTPTDEEASKSVFEERFDLTNQVLEFIKENFYDDLDYDMADLYAAYGLVSSLGEYNYIYAPEERLGITADGKGFGLLIKNSAYNEHIVDFILPGSPFLTPCDGKTVARGDELYAINDQRMSGIVSSTYSAYLATLPSDEPVKFTIKRGEEMFDVSYQKIDFSFPYCIYINDLPGVPSNFGYICLRTFDNSTNVLNEFKSAVRSFNSDGNRALILDLRSNGGGSANVLGQIASTLVGHDVPAGEVLFEIHYAKQDRSNFVYYTPMENKIDVPVYVLCNGGTASASEALIGTMKAHGTLTALIGQTTVGKGVAQNGFTTYQKGEKGILTDKGLDEDGNEVDIGTYLMQIIVGKYYIYDPAAEGGKYCIHGNPFTPDILISGVNPITPDYSDDLYIKAAIEHYNND